MDFGIWFPGMLTSAGFLGCYTDSPWVSHTQAADLSEVDAPPRISASELVVVTSDHHDLYLRENSKGLIRSKIYLVNEIGVYSK